MRYVSRNSGALLRTSIVFLAHPEVDVFDERGLSNRHKSSEMFVNDNELESWDIAGNFIHTPGETFVTVVQSCVALQSIIEEEELHVWQHGSTLEFNISYRDFETLRGEFLVYPLTEVISQTLFIELPFKPHLNYDGGLPHGGKRPKINNRGLVVS